MCGIAGYLGPKEERPLEELRDRLTHRGPDSFGVWRDEQAGVGLGHRRLSIIDLSNEGHQPMSNRHLHLVYNGEVYNFLSLRRELEALGHGFRGGSDTEVLLAAVLEWGLEKTLPRLNGMFAIALWDSRDRVLYLARDRYGKKPLYYGKIEGTWYFGSELKALPCQALATDRQGLGTFLRYGYLPAPLSIFEGVKKLPPAHWCAIRADDFQVVPRCFWSVPPAEVDPQLGAEQLEAALMEAVRLRMVSDVPLGAFLSGGIDSSLIVALMQKQSARPVRTFCIGFQEQSHDESPYARQVALQLGTEHTELRVTAQQALDVVPLLPTMYDEPFADSSQIPTFLVSQLARQHVTVALSGDGGDEVFGGYNRYQWVPRIWRRLRLLPRPFRVALAKLLSLVPISAIAPLIRSVSYPEEKLNKLLQLLPLKGPDQMYLQLVSQWAEPTRLLPEFLELPLPGGYDLGTPEGMMAVDALTYLPDDILVKVDRASMAVSLECRAPFLDPEVADLAWRLAPSHRSGKAILRQILAKHLSLPDRPKAGFSLPLGRWLCGPLRDWAEGLLSQVDDFDRRPIMARWHEHLQGRRDWNASLWCVLMYQAWKQKWRGGA